MVPICDIMAGLTKSLSDLVLEARSIGSNASTLVIWSDLVRGVSSPPLVTCLKKRSQLRGSRSTTSHLAGMKLASVAVEVLCRCLILSTWKVLVSVDCYRCKLSDLISCIYFVRRDLCHVGCARMAGHP